MVSGPLIPPRLGESQEFVPSGEALLALTGFWQLLIKGGYQALSTRSEDNSIQPLGGLTL